MSEFERAHHTAQRRKGLSTLQIAWLTVLLAMSGVVLWLLLSPPPKSLTASAPETGLTAPETTLPAANEVAEVPAPLGEPTDKTTEQQTVTDTAGDAAVDTIAEEQTTSAQEQALPVSSRDEVILTPAPADGLAEDTALGPLPKKDGAREPWQVYARPFAPAGSGGASRPRIAIVVTGLGLSKSITEVAITTLPPDVSLAFSPYGDALQDRINTARQAGHEVLLMAPMEPHNYPANDPGPHTLLVNAAPADNLAKLHWVMSRATGYVGLVNEMGSSFTASEAAMTPALQELAGRGLLFMDARSSQHSVAATLARQLRVPRIINNRYIDNDRTEDSIRARLQELENLAMTYGASAGIARPYPLSIRVITEWAKELNARNIDLAPVSAVANRQPVR